MKFLWNFCFFFTLIQCIDLNELENALEFSTDNSATVLYDFVKENPDQISELLDTKNSKLIVPLVNTVEKLLLENDQDLVYRIFNHPLAINWDESFNKFYYMGIKEMEYLTRSVLGSN